MNRTDYMLRPRSGSWAAHPSNSHLPEYRLLQFDMTVARDGRPLGGHNVQIVVGAPDQRRRGLDEEIALRLDSGWWVTLRNQFAQAPCEATEILESVKDELSAITAKATDARGLAAKEVTDKLFATVFIATGPDYWR